MEDWLDRLSQLASANGVSETIVLIVSVLVVRSLAVTALRRRTEVLSENRRRWISIVQNGAIIIILFGLLLIWSPELSTFALSIAAFAVALAIISKEFVLCVVGAVHRAITRPFEIGDWIELDGMRGEVLHEGMLSVRLQELGTHQQQYQYTGRVLTLPNSLLLNHTVRNESFRKRFVHHRFSVVIEPGADPLALKRLIVARLAAKRTDFEDIAQRYWTMVRRKIQTELPSPEPSVHIRTTDFSKIVFDVTVFCPTTEAAAIESHVTELVLCEVAKGAKTGEGEDAAKS